MQIAPYAEVATFLLASKSKSLQNLTLALSQQANNQSSLLIKDIEKNSSQSIQGKTSITKFFSRQFASNLYEIASAQTVAQIDYYVDACRKKDSQIILKKVKENQLISEKPNLGDILIWDYLKNLPKEERTDSTLKYIKMMEKKLPELSQAVFEVNSVFATEPVLNQFKAKIVEKLSTLLNVAEDLAYESLEVPNKSINGDFAFPIPRLKLPGNPVQIAKELQQKIKTDEYILKVTAFGPFLNFFINKNLLTQKLLPQILTQDTKYGNNYDGVGKTALVEYSSPNIAKPFHFGHIRSTIIGNFVKNVLNATGWHTVSINYLGDWGKQYGLLAVGFEKYGDEELLQKDPIKHLFDVYVQINKDGEEKDENGNSEVHDSARRYFKKMEDGDADALKLWQRFRDMSITKYREVYGRLNIMFDIYSGESQYSYEQCKEVLDELQGKNLLVPSDGALIVDLTERNLGTAVIGKSDGSLLYLSRDIAAAISRHEIYNFDKLYYVVASQQNHHFKQLFTILEEMGKPWVKNCEHINFGMILDMSTRRGNVVFLEELLDATQESMHEVMKKNEEKYNQIENPDLVADTVGLSAIMIQDMSSRRNKDYSFVWSRMLSFEGDTGPYLQYAHSRLRSIERKAEEAGIVIPEDLVVNFNLLVEPQAVLLMNFLAKFPEVVKEVSKSFEPCGVVQYCFELCHNFSSTYEQLYVLNQEKELAVARLALYKSARITLGNGLRLLGIM
ncbi:hypothetical protein HDU92_005716 [Lobulomyces angularis]|nr:hypothetical protein HDU92_005716 [Lobulomyces angularis]